MSRGDWNPHFAIRGLALTALFLFFSLAWLLSYQREHSQQRQAAATEQAEAINEKRQSTCLDVAKSHSFPCTVQASAAEPSDKYTAYDLQAQQDMAEWAAAMVFLSGIGVLVTGAATIYVALTLQETRRMARQAEITNHLAREMGEAQVRAYVYVTDLTVKLKDSIPWVTYRVMNSGNSPATLVTCTLRSSYSDTQGFAEPMTAKMRYVAGAIPSGESYSPTENALPELGDIRERTQGIITSVSIEVDVTYRDVFKKDRRSQRHFMGIIRKDWNNESIKMICLEYDQTAAKQATID